MVLLFQKIVKISKRNFNLLWVVIDIAIVIKNVNWSDLGYCSNPLSYFVAMVKQCVLNQSQGF
jgi:hypothetical protein